MKFLKINEVSGFLFLTEMVYYLIPSENNFGAQNEQKVVWIMKSKDG